MSASLVGSEMCIRDSSRARALTQASSRALARARERKQMDARAQTRAPTIPFGRSFLGQPLAARPAAPLSHMSLARSQVRQLRR
eukprot:5447764-Alexandrium_andersonii.AAC.2